MWIILVIPLLIMFESSSNPDLRQIKILKKNHKYYETTKATNIIINISGCN